MSEVQREDDVFRIVVQEAAFVPVRRRHRPLSRRRSRRRPAEGDDGRISSDDHGTEHTSTGGLDGVQRQEARIRDVEDFRLRVERCDDNDRRRLRPRSTPPAIVFVVPAAAAIDDDVAVGSRRGERMVG